MGGKLRHLAGHPVVETGADGDEHIGMGHGHVGAIGAVHAQHPQPEGVGAGKPPKPMRVVVTGICKARGEFVQLLRACGENDAAPGINHRLLGLEDHIQGPFHLPGIGMVGGVVALDLARLSGN